MLSASATQQQSTLARLCALAVSHLHDNSPSVREVAAGTLRSLVASFGASTHAFDDNPTRKTIPKRINNNNSEPSTNRDGVGWRRCVARCGIAARFRAALAVDRRAMHANRTPTDPNQYANACDFYICVNLQRYVCRSKDYGTNIDDVELLCVGAENGHWLC
jgi:hypothetical protein